MKFHMKKTYEVVLVSLVVASICSAQTFGPMKPLISKKNISNDKLDVKRFNNELLVKFKKNSAVGDTKETYNSVPEWFSDNLQEIDNKFNLKELKRNSKPAKDARRFKKLIKTDDDLLTDKEKKLKKKLLERVGLDNNALERCFKAEFSLSEGQSIEDVLNYYKADSTVEWVEVNHVCSFSATPSDPKYPSQAHLPLIKAPAAWDVTMGNSSVVVAVIDAGMQLNHSDLKNNLWVNASEIPGDGLDNDQNGYIDDINGFDFSNMNPDDLAAGDDGFPQDNDPTDHDGHGTFLAGLIAAVANNGVGGVGVAPNCKIMPLRVASKIKFPEVEGSPNVLLASIFDISDAIYYAVDNGADVINMSFGAYYNSSWITDAVNYANSMGVVCVASAGNETDLEYFSGKVFSSSIQVFPASCDNVVGVTSLKNGTEISEFSNFGPWVNIAAPGENIYSTTIGGSYTTMSGASCATAIVSGVAALVRSAHPDWTVDQVVKQIYSTATSLDTYNPELSGMVGAGCVNAQKAVGTLSSTDNFSVISTVIDDGTGGDNDDIIDPGETIKLYLSLKNFAANKDNIAVELTTTNGNVTLINKSVNYGSIWFNRVVTNSKATPFSFSVKTGIPKQHTIEFTANIKQGGTTILTKKFSLTGNPLLSNPHISFPQEVSEPSFVLSTTDNAMAIYSVIRPLQLDTYLSSVITVQRNGPTGEERLFSSTNDFQAENCDYFQLPSKETFGSFLDSRVKNGVSEKFLFALHANNGYSDIVLSVPAIGGENDFKQISQIAADNNSVGHIVYDMGNKLYYGNKISYDWSSPALIWNVPTDMPNYTLKNLCVGADNSLHLFIEHDGKEKVISATNTASNTWDWGSPVILDAAYTGGVPFNKGTDIVKTYLGGTTTLKVARFTGSSWTKMQDLYSGATTANDITINWLPSGNIRVFSIDKYTESASSDSVYNNRQLFYREYASGVWSPFYKISMRSDKYYNVAHYSMTTDESNNSYFVANRENLRDFNHDYLGNKINIATRAGVFFTTKDLGGMLPSRPEVKTEQSEILRNNVFYTNSYDTASIHNTNSTSYVGYRYCVGSAPGLNDIRDWVDFPHYRYYNDTSFTFTRDLIDLKQNQMYYVTAQILAHGYSSPLGFSEGHYYRKDAGYGSFKESGGLVCFEAENYTATTSNKDSLIWSKSDGYYSNENYFITSQSSGNNASWAGGFEVSYDINFATKGDYYVWVRGHNNASSSDNSMFVGIDGKQAGTEFSNSLTDAFTWSKHTSTIDVSSVGMHKFQMRRREDGFVADRFVLTTNSNYNPALFGDGFGPTQSNRDNIIIGNKFPTVKFTRPSNDTTVNELESVSYMINATDKDGIVEYVTLFNAHRNIIDIPNIKNSSTFTTKMLFVVGTHYLSAKAYDNDGFSTLSEGITVNVVPNKPGNFQATVVSGDQIDLKWTNNQYADKYQLYYSKTNSKPPSPTAVLENDLTSQFYVTGLSPNATYYFWLEAVADELIGATSTLNAKTSSILLSNGTFESGNLNGWTVGEGCGTRSPSTYSHTGNYSAWAGNKDFMYQTISGLSSNAKYTFTVWLKGADASNIANVTISDYSGAATQTQSNSSSTWTKKTITFTTGSSENSAKITLSQTGGGWSWVYFDDISIVEDQVGGIPAAPGIFQATTTSNTQVNLSWVDNSDNETGFSLYQSTTSKKPSLPVGTVSANKTTYAATGLEKNTTYNFWIEATNGSGASSPISASATTTNYQAGCIWSHENIGSVGNVGTVDGCVDVMTGSGSDIYGTEDAFNFAYHESNASEDSLIVQVTSMTNTNAWAKAGVMIRQDLTANSKYVGLFMTPSNGATLQWRAEAGAYTGATKTSSLSCPYWVKIKKSGTTISTYFSADGSSWSSAGTARTVDFGSSYFIGLAVTSHDNTALCTVNFSDLQ